MPFTIFTGINSLTRTNVANWCLYLFTFALVKLESGPCLTRLADYPNANALQEVAQPTGITFTGAGIALYLNVAGELEVRDRALVMNVFILTRVAWM